MHSRRPMHARRLQNSSCHSLCASGRFRFKREMKDDRDGRSQVRRYPYTKKQETSIVDATVYINRRSQTDRL